MIEYILIAIMMAISVLLMPINIFMFILSIISALLDGAGAVLLWMIGLIVWIAGCGAFSLIDDDVTLGFVFIVLSLQLLTFLINYLVFMSITVTCRMNNNVVHYSKDD